MCDRQWFPLGEDALNEGLPHPEPIHSFILALEERGFIVHKRVSMGFGGAHPEQSTGGLYLLASFSSVQVAQFISASTQQ